MKLPSPLISGIGFALLTTVGVMGEEPVNKVISQLKMGHVLRKQGMSTAAEEVFAHVLADDAASGPARSEAQVWTAHLLQRDGEWQKAEKAFSKVFYIEGANPHHISEAHTWLGELYFVRGDLHSAKNEFETVLRLNTHVPGHVKMAQDRLKKIAAYGGGI